MKIIECPRDAMQGIKRFIPTELKIEYISLLLKVGFDTIDFGSFVSPKAIPQLQDTAEVVRSLDLSNTNTKLLSIIANVRGAEEAAIFNEITYLGYPLSISETFQKRNTNRSIEDAFRDLASIQNICIKSNKKLVTYLSMGFGNPYGDPYNAEFVINFVEKLKAIDVQIISLSDTIGVSKEENINYLFRNLIPAFPGIEFGAHLHSTPDTASSKINAAYISGCKRFDVALSGFGGCPMAEDDLVGNIATEVLINYLKENKIPYLLKENYLLQALELVPAIFNN